MTEIGTPGWYGPFGDAVLAAYELEALVRDSGFAVERWGGLPFLA